MHGAVLSNNIVLIAFVLHNLTPSLAGSLFFPSIVDLDSAVKYFQSPKFNVAMKSFKQEFSKYVRSMFMDLSLNIASKFRGFYDTLDTYSDNKILSDTILLRSGNEWQSAGLRKLQPETKLLPEENPPSNNSASENNLNRMDSTTDEVVKELNPSVIGRTDQKKVKMKNLMRRRKSRLRGYVRKLNNSRKSVVLRHFNSKNDQFRVNNSNVHSKVIGIEEDSAVPRILSNIYTILSKTTPREDLRHHKELKIPDTLSDSSEATAHSNSSNSERDPQINENAPEIDFKNFHNFKVAEKKSTTEFIAKANTLSLNSSPHANTPLFNILSKGMDLTRETNNTVVNGDSRRDLDSIFSKLLQPSKPSTLGEGSQLIEKQQLLPTLQKYVNDVTFKHILDLNATKPIRMLEKERKLLVKQRNEKSITKERTTLRYERLASNRALRLSQSPNMSLKSATEEVISYRPKLSYFKSGALNNLKTSQELRTEAVQNETEAHKFANLSARNNENSNLLITTDRSTSTKTINKNNSNGKHSSISISMPVLLDAYKRQTSTPTTYLTTEEGRSDIFSLSGNFNESFIEERSLIPATIKPILQKKTINESTEIFKLKAAVENIKIGSESTAREESKMGRRYYANSPIKMSIRKDMTRTQITVRPRRILIKSRIKKRAAYDALMNMIASRWAKANNEEAEVEEAVTDDAQYDDKLELKLKEPIKSTFSKKVTNVNHAISHTHTHDFIDNVHIPKQHEPSLPHDIHGKISNLCLSFDSMNRKNKTALSDQSSTTNDWTSASSVAKLKRSFPEKINRTSVVKRKKKRRNNKPKALKSAIETNRLLDIAFEQFEDKLKSIIQSSWTRENLWDLAQISEDLVRANVHLASGNSAQKDLQNYVASTCKQTWDKLQNQIMRQTKEINKTSKMYEEEVTTVETQIFQSSDTSKNPFSMLSLDHLIKTTLHNSTITKTSIEIQKFDVGRNTSSYLLSPEDGSRETIPDEQLNLHSHSKSMPADDATEKSLKKQLHYPPCVPVIGATKQGEETRIMFGTSQATMSSTTSENYFLPGELQYPRLNFPMNAPVSGESRTLMEPDLSKTLMKSVPGIEGLRDNIKSQIAYQSSLEKPKPKSENHSYTPNRPFYVTTSIDMPTKLEDSDVLGAPINSASNDKGGMYDTKSERMYQTSLLKPKSETYLYATDSQNLPISTLAGVPEILADPDDSESSITDVTDDFKSERAYEKSVLEPKNETYFYTTNKLNLPITATTSMLEKLVDSEDLESPSNSVSDSKQVKDDTRTELEYQQILVKPTSETHFHSTKKPIDRDPTFKLTVQKTPVKGNIMRLNRKLETFLASPGDVTVSYSLSPENLRKSIENFKRIARLNWELSKNINADAGFSIAELNPESLGLPPLPNEAISKPDEDDNENLEDEPDSLSTQSSRRLTESLMASLKTSPPEVEIPKEEHDEYVKLNSYIDYGRVQSFKQQNDPQKCVNACEDPRLRLFTRSDTRGNNNQEEMSYQPATPRTFYTQGYNGLMTTAPSQRFQDGNEPELPVSNKLKLSGQSHVHKDPYATEFFQYSDQTKAADELDVSTQDYVYNEDNQNEKFASQVQLEKPNIFQHYNPNDVNLRQRYSITTKTDEASESHYRVPLVEAELDENNEPSFTSDLLKPNPSPASEATVSELDCNRRGMKSETDLYSSKVRPNVSVSYLCITTPMNRHFTTLRMSTWQETPALAVIPTQRPMTLPDGDHVEPTSRRGRKHMIKNRKPHPHTTREPRVGDSTKIADNRQPFRTRYHKGGEPQFYEGLKNQVTSREEYPLEEAQTYSAFKLGYKKKMAVRVQKYEIPSTEPFTENVTFHLTTRSPVNRTALRKRQRMRKPRIRGGASSSGNHGEASDINYISSTERLLERLSSFTAPSAGFNIENAKNIEPIDQQRPAEPSKNEEAFKIENHTPRMSLGNENKSKGRRFYNRGNRPLSQLYGKEYTSWEFLSASKTHLFSSRSLILDSTTVASAVIQKDEKAQQTSPSYSNEHSRLKSKSRTSHSKRRKTTTLVYQNTGEDDMVDDRSS